MPYEESSGADLIIDVLVLAAVIAILPNKNELPSVILLSLFAIAMVAMESKVRGFRLTSYVSEGMKAFRPMYWATALLLLTLHYKPLPGIDIWSNRIAAFFISTLLVFLAMLMVAYRAAASHE